MARCWTCGSEKPEFGFTCSVCTQTKELVNIRENLESMSLAEIKTTVDFSGIDFWSYECFPDISDSLSEIADAIWGLASTIEWGFEDLSWKIEQMTGVLKSINETLRHPGQTQANEWREIAEELRRREVLNEAESFFLKSIRANPLDYRVYIGLGKTYLRMGKIDEAKNYFKESLPHAPKAYNQTRKINYKSYSHRLIGRIYFCKKEYQRAVLELQKAIGISPEYYIGYFDYAQYSASTGDIDNSFHALKIVLPKNSHLCELAKTAESLRPLREKIISFIKSEDFLREAEEWREMKFNVRLSELSVNWLYKEIEEFVQKMEVRFTIFKKKYREEIYKRKEWCKACKDCEENLEGLKGVLKYIKRSLRTGGERYFNSEDFGNLYKSFCECIFLTKDVRRTLINCIGGRYVSKLPLGLKRLYLRIIGDESYQGLQDLKSRVL